MRAAWLVLVLACTAGSLRSQQILLKSQTDSTVIAYAHVRGAEYRTISNTTGSFRWPASWESSDSLVITCIGYDRLVVKGPPRELILFMKESITTLKPVLISGLPVEERLFRIVENMQQDSDWKQSRHATYWRGVFEEEELVERFIARISGRAEAWKSDSVRIAEGCADFNLSSLSDEHSLFGQNQVFPASGCLNRNNKDLWVYSLDEQQLSGGELHSLVRAEFYSPDKNVEHRYLIWINEDRKQVLRIEFSYRWRLDFPVTLTRRQELESNLRAYSGHVLFSDGRPVYLDALYTLEVCAKFNKAPCRSQQVYHEYFQQEGGSRVLPVNVKFFEYLERELSCESEL